MEEDVAAELAAVSSCEWHSVGIGVVVRGIDKCGSELFAGRAGQWLSTVLGGEMVLEDVAMCLLFEMV